MFGYFIIKTRYNAPSLIRTSKSEQKSNMDSSRKLNIKLRIILDVDRLFVDRRFLAYQKLELNSLLVFGVCRSTNFILASMGAL